MTPINNNQMSEELDKETRDIVDDCVMMDLTPEAFEDMRKRIINLNNKTVQRLRLMPKRTMDMSEVMVFKDTNFDTEIKQQNIYLAGYNRAVEDLDNNIRQHLQSLGVERNQMSEQEELEEKLIKIEKMSNEELLMSMVSSYNLYSRQKEKMLMPQAHETRKDFDLYYNEARRRMGFSVERRLNDY